MDEAFCLLEGLSLKAVVEAAAEHLQPQMQAYRGLSLEGPTCGRNANEYVEVELGGSPRTLGQVRGLQ